MTAHDTQSFFTPKQFLCHTSTLTSAVYNIAHVLLNRSNSDHIFVPIRSMQYLAIIEKETFWFVDSQAYAVQGDEGGRLIRVSWHPLICSHERSALNQAMDCRVIFYGEDMQEAQVRLSGEFYQAMQLLDQRQRDSFTSQGKINILALKSL